MNTLRPIDQLRNAQLRITSKKSLVVRMWTAVGDMDEMNYGNPCPIFAVREDPRCILFVQTRTHIEVHQLVPKFRWGVHAIPLASCDTPHKAARRIREVHEILNGMRGNSPPLFGESRISPNSVFSRMHKRAQSLCQVDERFAAGPTANDEFAAGRLLNKTRHDFFHMVLSGVRYRVVHCDAGTHTATLIICECSGKAASAILRIPLDSVFTERQLDIAFQSIVCTVELHRRSLPQDMKQPTHTELLRVFSAEAQDPFEALRRILKDCPEFEHITDIFEKNETVRAFTIRMNGIAFDVDETPHSLNVWRRNPPPPDTLIATSAHKDFVPQDGTTPEQELQERASRIEQLMLAQARQPVPA